MLTTNLFREMENLRREIDDAFRGVRWGRTFEPEFLPGLGLSSYPQVNLTEDENNLYVEALVPGVDSNDLDLNVMNRTLTLAGERKPVARQGVTIHRNERGDGKFLRTIELPVDIDSRQVKADFSNGVLTVTLPKAEAAKPRKITVKAS